MQSLNSRKKSEKYLKKLYQSGVWCDEMWPFKKKGEVEVVAKIEKLDDTLSVSFSRVKQDMDKMHAWVSWLYHQHAEQQKAIHILQENARQSSSMTSEQVRGMIEQHMPSGEISGRIDQVEHKVSQVAASVHSTEPLMKRVSELNSEIRVLEESQKPIMDRLREISAKVDKMGQARPRNVANLREKIMKKVAQRSKDYIKNLILSTIRKYDKVSGLQLREMIVEEQALCSKSSFYRFLAEIEQGDEVDVVPSGKEKVYLPKISKTHTVK
jgi:hypothetical protein